MADSKSPSILLLYPSCLYYADWMERVQVKTSQVWLASYLNRFFPVTYGDLEIELGRPNSRVQVRRFQRKVRQYLSDRQFDVLAISCWTSLSYQVSRIVAQACRELYPDTPIIVGGYHPSARPNEFFDYEDVFDYVVIGEGELAVRQLLEQNGAMRPDRPQLIHGPTVTSDEFVECDWSLVEPFVRRNFPEGLPNVYMYLSRGCPFGCSFCMEPLKDQAWRAFDPVGAVDSMFSAVDRFGSIAVAVSDACFGMRPKWRKQFLRECLQRDLPFWIVFETRPEYLDQEDIEYLSHLKTEVQFGIESCSPDILRLMQKTRQPEKFLSTFELVSNMLTENRVLHRANLIFNHPGETEKTLKETFSFIDRMTARTDSFLMWACHGYMHFPGCEIDRNRTYYESEFGATFPPTDWWKGESDQYEASLANEPSHDLRGQRAHLWEQMLAARDQQLRNCLSDRSFRFAAAKYFLNWQEDSRYARSEAASYVS